MITKNPVSFPDGDPRKRMEAYLRRVLDGATVAVSVVSAKTERQAKNILTDLDAVDRGLTRASVDHQVFVQATKVTGYVFDGAAHGKYVELGRAGVESDPTTDPRAGKAAWPPVQAIMEWAARNARKIAIAGRTPSGRARRAADAAIRSFAFLVGRKIYRHGIKPRPHLQPAQDLVAPEMPRIMADAIKARTQGLSA